MKVILATGIAGVGKNEYLNSFLKICEKNKKRCQVISLGKIIFDIAGEMGINVSENKILNLPRSTLKALTSLALERLPKIFDKSADAIIVSTHASYWWKNGPEHAFDVSILNTLNPDLYITFINSPSINYENIVRDKKWGKGIISLREVMIWTELEIYTTEIFALLQGKSQYVIHMNHPVENLYRLIFEPKIKKFYISFPMTFASGQTLKKIKKFINEIQKYAIIIEPLLENDLVNIKDKELNNILSNQVVRRDYHFIDQADGIIIYYPKILPSPGVESERAYAHQTDKLIWIIYPSSKKSPFINYSTDRFFKNTNEVIKELKKMYEHS